MSRTPCRANTSQLKVFAAILNVLTSLLSYWKNYEYCTQNARKIFSTIHEEFLYHSKIVGIKSSKKRKLFS